jgi:hypothetical protein
MEASDWRFEMLSRNGHAVLAAVAVSAAFGALGCGDDALSAGDCVKSWNAKGNVHQQSTLAGAMAADISLDGDFRVGTWPSGERKVPVTDGFAARPSGDGVVAKHSCVVVMPPSRVGRMAFFEADAKWRFVRDNTGSQFPADALRELAKAPPASPNALGQLELRETRDKEK